MKNISTTARPRTPIALLLLALGTALATFPTSASASPTPGAQPPDQSLLEDPRFFIETIEVDGLKRASREILVSESLLEEGAEYGESDLRQAIYRINRLPFVLESRFALARGSERGKLRLIIEVDEVARLFFGGEANVTAFGRDLALDRLEPEDVSRRADALVGARFFLGKLSTFFAAATTNGSVQLGLARYQLLGRRVFMGLGLVRQGCCPVTVRPLALDPTFSRWSADEGSLRGTITLGIPLGGNHSLRFEAWRFQPGGGGDLRGSRAQMGGASGSTGAFNLHGDLVDQAVELAWIFDSTDDPTFASRGITLSMTYEMRELRADLLRDDSPRTQPLEMRSRMERVTATATRHWPLSPRQSVSAGARLAVGRSRVANVPLAEDVLLDDEDLVLREAGLSLRYSLALWRSEHPRAPGEMRWETTSDLGWEGTSPTFGLPDNPLRRWSLDSSLVVRSRWGIFRFGLTYVDVGEAG